MDIRMNALIVDDDRFVVAALREGIDWKGLGFAGIYSAYNISDAMSLIKTHTIHLLLCDIDMPHGSGLDLLAWIRDSHHDILVIFLTNYANFEYVQKALVLDSFHYFLKPVEYDKLSEIIRNATAHLTRQNMHISIRCEHFWNAFIHGEISNEPKVLETYILQMQLSYTQNDYFLPVVFDLFPYHLTKEKKLISSFSFVNQPQEYIRSIFQATFADLLQTQDAFIEYDHSLSQFLSVFCLKTTEIPPLLSMYCESFIDSVSRQLRCDLNCYIGQPSQFSTFRSNFLKLRSMMADSLDHKGSICLLSDYHPMPDYYPDLDTKILEFYLQNMQYPAFLDHCHQYLRKLSATGCLHQISIASFQEDVSQLIYTFLKSKGVLTNKLFQDESYHILFANAKYSVYYMEMYLSYVIAVIQNNLENANYKKSIAKSIKDYVDQHYAEDIHRNCLSDIFYLDENYGSKIFKRETGISFKDYIIQKRIDAAKDLLRNTELPINTVANNVGYDNYSYFSRIFKKVTNMTPIEYRNNRK